MRALPALLPAARPAAAECRQGLILAPDGQALVNAVASWLQAEGTAAAPIPPSARTILLDPAAPPAALAVFLWPGVGSTRWCCRGG